MPVTPSQRASLPTTCPQAFMTRGFHEDARATRSGGAVVWRTWAPDVTLTPRASAQQSGAMAGVVPVGASFDPTVVQLLELVPCRRLTALSSCAGVVSKAGDASCSGSGCAGS